MEPIVLDILADACASSICIIVVAIIAFIIFICIILWRFSGRKRVEYHTTTIEKSSKSERYCPQCGRGIPFDAQLCPYCGRRF